MTQVWLWMITAIAGSSGFTSELTIQPESIFAIITHKAGLLANLGHNHLIYANKYDVQARLDGEDLNSFRFEITISVDGLIVDDPQVNSKWFPMIKEAAILDEAFSEVSKKDRKKIRNSMLGKKQLKADKFPLIKAWVEDVREKKGQVGILETTHELMLKIEIHDLQQTVAVPARILRNEQGLQILAIAPLKFSDFGIDPFSAMLGTVANEDRFHLFVNLLAH